MGAFKDEATGTAKKVAGKLVADEDLRDKGEDQIAKGVEEDEEDRAERPGRDYGTGEKFGPFAQGAEANRAEERGEPSPEAKSYPEEYQSDWG